MSSVTRIIKDTKQPYGGYLPVADLGETVFNDGVELYNENDPNVHPSIVGLAVDYLTRYYMGEELYEAFDISLRGATIIGDEEYLKGCILAGINRDDLPDYVIVNACQAAGYDTVYRAGPHTYKPVAEIEPNERMISDIRHMVKRTLKFFEEYGPVVDTGMTFEGGYTEKVSVGDADILTLDGLWDLKVIRGRLTSKHTLQILMYYLMGLNSDDKSKYEGISKLGFFNPRTNTVYKIDIENIDPDILEEVASNVIGY